MRVFVYGWYGNQNLGDEAFKDAFRYLFPSVQFTFNNYIPENINDYDAVWFGGGSFLDGPIVNPHKIEITKPTAFIGVGLPALVESIPPSTATLLKQAKLVLPRDSQSAKVAQRLGINAVAIPDLAFATPNLHPRQPQSKKITVLCNDNFTPRDGSPEYKVLSYYWYVAEFSGVCNKLIEQGYDLEFIPMNVGDIDDRRYAAIIHSRILDKSKAVWHLDVFDHSMFEKAISESDLVISQRFHGIVFAIKYGVPFVCVSAADKFSTLMEDIGVKSYLDYYGFTKPRFFDAMNHSDSPLSQSFYSLTGSAFENVRKMVLEAFPLLTS